MEYSEKLRTVIGGMISHMKKYLPYGEIFIIIRFFDRLGEQHIVPQLGKVDTNILLRLVPIGANDISIIKVSSRKRF